MGFTSCILILSYVRSLNMLSILVIPAVNSNDTPMPLLPDAASLDGSCKCQLRFNDNGRHGCIIVEPAPKGKGCQCVHTIPWEPDVPETCDGTVAECADKNNEWCMNPDKSFLSCHQGLIVPNDYLIYGNCFGYNNVPADEPLGCKCDRVPPNSLGLGGCIITEAAPEFLSCKCTEIDYLLHYECVGTVVQCLDWEDPLCDNPDTSLESCLLASGTDKNCEGYK